MSTESLMELLARETEKLTELLAGKKFDAEYEKCKDGIKQIQVIIDIRKGIAATSKPLLEEPGFNSASQIQNNTGKTTEY